MLPIWCSPKNCPFLTKRQKYRLLQVQYICRRQIESDPNGGLVCIRMENIVEKGENTVYHFLLYHRCFPKCFFFFTQVGQTRDCVKDESRKNAER